MGNSAYLTLTLLISIQIVSVLCDIRCGISNTKDANTTKCDPQSERIINGQCAKPGQIPWVTMVQILLWGREIGFCGGAILDPWTIMTAGHCAYICPPFPFPGFPVREFNISIGERNLKNDSDGQMYYKSTKVIVHPSYKYCSQNNSNDIALLKIDEPGMKVPYFSANGLGSTNTICEPSTNTDYTGQTATIAGWGRTSPNNDQTANILQYANVTIISNAECQKTYNSSVDDNMICAMGSNGESSCNGDSGTAMYTQQANAGGSETEAVAVGITSFGVVNCQGAPVVYTRVSKYLHFINSNLGAPKDFRAKRFSA